MQNLEEKIKELEEKMSELVTQQNKLNLSIFNLSDEINRVKKLTQEEKKTSALIPEKTDTTLLPPETVKPTAKEKPAQQTKVQRERKAVIFSKTSSRGFEEFIGRNIASKVGILVTIIGVFIGAKYAIDKDLVSPFVRIMLGYLAGVVLTSTALWLKKKYHNYSAVLLGGGLAVLYFITYIAFSFYQLIPQGMAFAIMFAITTATVYGAIIYDQVIIAHIGLIGAYAIPYLLSNNAAQYTIFFSYIAIINTGILVLSFLRYWKSLFHTSFFLTWFIYAGWYLVKYNQESGNSVAWVFLSIFFVQFYTCFLVYKLIKKEQYGGADVVTLLINSFIFYAFGYALLGESNNTDLAGAFTLLNAAIHLCVVMLVKYFKLSDKAMQWMIAGLAVAFITIAIPVQFDGNWVTLLWAAQTVVLFYAGRANQRPGYEKTAMVLSMLTVLSQLYDWVDYSFANDRSATPFFNIKFFSPLIVCLFFGLIVYLHNSKKFVTSLKADSTVLKYFQWTMPFVLIMLAYVTGFIEMDSWTNKKAAVTNQDVWINYTPVILLSYSLIFIYTLCAINFYGLKKELFARYISPVLLFAFFLSLTIGLSALGSLREQYLHEKQGSVVYYFSLHYLLFGLITAGLVIFYYWLSPYWKNTFVSRFSPLAVHAVTLTLVSNEYIQWMDIIAAGSQYKLGLSIVWGVYALMLIVLGIWKKRKYLRIGAIVLFTGTLLKLFFYDLAGLSTITKTISFISLGVILLVVSFLYNRYKHIILTEDD